MRGPGSVTLGLAALAVAMVVVVHADPWAPERAAAPMLSAQSVTRRLFPELAEGALAQATIEVRRPAGVLRLAPDEDGLHRVWQDDAPLGWVDSEALAGLWSSLRMATTLRAVAPGSPPGALRGEIAVWVAGEERSVRIFGETGDGVGLYGMLPHEGDAVWVVEPELGVVLGQAPEGWLLRRLLPVEPAEAAALLWDGLGLARGVDGLWRVTAGGPKLLLADQAVALRLGQALSAEFDPLLARADAAKYGPFVLRHRVTDTLGHVREVMSGGTCPEDPARVVVDRGPGLLGCVAAEALRAFPVADPDAGLVEPQLVPYAYGRVLAVERATSAGPRRLRRLGGGWVIEEAGALVEVSEPEVFRWYGALQAAAVELPAEALVMTARDRLTIETDAGQLLVIACGPVSGGIGCARDEGPVLRVVGGLPALDFVRETFADRRLLSFASGEVRGLELLPGPASDGVRQSVRLDLGVWRLDAPAHPDGVAVLDEVRLEATLAALQSLRAEGWTPVPATSATRTLRVERLRAGQDDAALVVDVYGEAEQCVAHVSGQAQAARLAAETCAALADDLLYNDPLRFWLGQARSAQVTATGGVTALLRREGDAWSVESGDDSLLAQLLGWAAFRGAGIRSGEPRGAGVMEAKIWRSGAAAVRVDLGPVVDGAPAWVRLVGQPWFYAAGVHEEGAE